MIMIPHGKRMARPALATAAAVLGVVAVFVIDHEVKRVVPRETGKSVKSCGLNHAAYNEILLPANSELPVLCPDQNEARVVARDDLEVHLLGVWRNPTDCNSLGHDEAYGDIESFLVFEPGGRATAVIRFFIGQPGRKACLDEIVFNGSYSIVEDRLVVTELFGKSIKPPTFLLQQDVLTVWLDGNQKEEYVRWPHCTPAGAPHDD